MFQKYLHYLEDRKISIEAEVQVESYWVHYRWCRTIAELSMAALHSLLLAIIFFTHTSQIKIYELVQIVKRLKYSSLKQFSMQHW